MTDDDLSDAVAVVGMAARVPGAADLDEFWSALVEGRDLTTRPGPGRAYGVVTGTDRFDAGFFGLAPQEAHVLDPQGRVLLECAWEALEHAGCDPHSYPGAVGVYAGSGDTDHLRVLRGQRHRFPGTTDAQLRSAASRDFLTSRVAYALDLRGPAVTVSTACSTSLVAVHLGCQALLTGDCDIALAGGVTVGGAGDGDDLLSPTGGCRPFDSDADGMVGADGAGVVVLKRLSDALADRDSVHAVLRGSALSNDGSGKVGFTAPGVAGQVAAIRSAHLLAGIDPGTVDHVEAHGTGTVIGDTIEVRALSEAFGPGTRGRCVLGSVKSNIGHADTAAGVLGLIKVLLSLRHGLIPGTAHFRRPNPHLDLAAGPFTVTGEATPWPPGERPRRAGVNAVGIGGTNAHLVVQEAPPAPRPPDDDGHHLLVLSARSAPALAESVARLRERLRRDPVAVADVAWTLQTGRAAFAHRTFVVCRDRDDAVAALTGPAGDPRAAVPAPARAPRVAFLFPGDGSAHVGAGSELYTAEPVFRAAVDDCADRAGDGPGPDLRQVLFPDPGAEARAWPTTAVGRAALFTVGHALAELWRSRGVEPHSVLGHGPGAYTAAVTAGVLTAADALSLVLADGDEEYAAALASVRLQPPQLPWISDRTGAQLTADEACDPARWLAHRRHPDRTDHPDRIGDAVATLLADPTGVLLDVGPGRTLGDLAGRHPGRGTGHTVVANPPDADAATGPDGAAGSLHATGALWQAGVPVRFSALHHDRAPRRVPLPTYPFQRERFALDGPAPGGEPATPEPGHPEAARHEAGQSEARQSETGPPAPGPGADRAASEPLTPVEEAIARVWREVLRVPHVGPDDDFFELGGHSLHATRVLARLGPALDAVPGTDAPLLTIMDVFDHATVRELAALVSGPDEPGGAAP